MQAFSSPCTTNPTFLVESVVDKDNNKIGSVVQAGRKAGGEDVAELVEVSSDEVSSEEEVEELTIGSDVEEEEEDGDDEEEGKSFCVVSCQGFSIWDPLIL